MTLEPVIFATILAAVVAACWCWFGFLQGRKKERKWWQDEMIRRRHAEFHWEDGKWYWREELPKTPRDPAAYKVKSKIDPYDLNVDPNKAANAR